MEARAFKALYESEIAKLEEVPLEVELVFARIYVKALEGMYELAHPKKEQTEESKPKITHKSHRGSTRPKINLGDFTCTVCGETRQKMSPAQKLCSISQSLSCSKYANCRNMWESRNKDSGIKYPLTFEEYKARNGKPLPRGKSSLNSAYVVRQA